MNPADMMAVQRLTPENPPRVSPRERGGKRSQMRFRHFIRAVAFGLSVTTLAVAASADVVGAQSFVEREHGQIKKLVDANAPSSEVTKAIDGMVDYAAVAQRA